MSIDTKLDICSRALILIGENPITSFDGDEPASVVASNIYDAAKRQLLSGYPWRFAATAETVNLLASPVHQTRYSGAYDMPSLVLRPMSLKDGTVNISPFEIFGNELHADASSASLDFYFIKNVNEDAMTEWFVGALQFRLAYLFAASITQSASLAGMWENEAEKELRRARFSDSLIDSPNTVEPTRLVSIRR